MGDNFCNENLFQVLVKMESQKSQVEKQPIETTTTALAAGTTPTPPAAAATPTSCRKKKNEQATFLEDVKDHIDEFIHASMDEHVSCFKKTIDKVCSCFNFNAVAKYCLPNKHVIL